MTIMIAHRGESFDAPENTLESVLLAWQRDDDCVEIDVHLTADSQIVVIHDQNTHRVTSGKYAFRIADASYRDLRKLDVGSWKNPGCQAAEIPLLGDILRTIPENPEKKLVIEIKTGPEIIPRLEEVILQSRRQSQIVIISFNLESLLAFRKRMPEIPLYYLCGIEQNSETENLHAFEYDPALIALACDHGFEGLDLDNAGITGEWVAAAHDEGLKVWTYTIDDPDTARKMVDCGVDAITSNKAAWLKKRLAMKTDE